MNDILKELQKFDFENQLKALARKYKNKRIVLYGAGTFFEVIKENFDLTHLNIISVSDKKFKNKKEPEYCETTCYNVISPEFIHTLNPDIVLITALHDVYIERDFYKELFKTTGKKFKFEAIFKLPLSEKIKRAWESY